MGAITRRKFFRLSAVGAAGVITTACTTPSRSDQAPNQNLLKPIDPKTNEEALEMLIAQEEYIRAQLKDSFEGTVLVLTEGASEVQKAAVSTQNKVIQQASELAPYVVPAIPLTIASAEILSKVVNVASSEFTINWVEVFHWVNHSKDAGIDIYQLAAFAKYIENIVGSCIRSEAGTTILRRPTTTLQSGKTLQEAYFFIKEVNGQQWVTILSPKGAAITSYNTGLKSGRYSAGEAARFLKTQQHISQTILSSDLPQEITEMWGKGKPPLLRTVGTSLQFAVKQVANELAVGAKLTAEQIVNQVIPVAEELSRSPFLVLLPRELICADPVFGQDENLCPAIEIQQ